MKKIILAIAAVFALSVGCKNANSSDPKGVVMSFMEALSKKDIEGAKKYATKDSEAMLGMIQMTMSMIPDSAKDKIYDKNNMEYGESIITGDKATVPVKDKKSGQTTNYTLKKENGSWKVAFDKATMTEMGKDKMKENGMDKMNNTNNSTDTTNHPMQNDDDKLKDTLH